RADMEVTTPGRRVGGAEVTSEHVGERHPHVATGRGVPNHRGDEIAGGLERKHRSYRGGFLSGPQPRLGNHSLAYPALQADIVEPGPEQPAVEVDQLVTGQGRDDFRAGGVGPDRVLELANQRRIGSPIEIFWWVEGRVALHKQREG